ncbi:sensor histidine kinase [Roseiterribacter gracilis]|uniref:Histidine kinase n=1 Tax=Roseiterribacter gracilis TaxID=2812848 RepID=A0A8S8XIF1_9PROT|nr:histidine kinase [Rhodospirillales bacterium TMPK1]
MEHTATQQLADSAPTTRKAAAWARRVFAPESRYPWLIYLLLYPMPYLYRAPNRTAILASLAGLAVFLVGYVGPKTKPGTRTHLWQVPLFAAIGFALVPFGGVWSVFTVYAGAAAGQLRPSRVALRALGGLALVIVLYGIASLSLIEFLPTLLLSCTIGGACFFQSELHTKNAALERAQQEVRTLAVTAERERIARDLHDVLGHTLTLVSVKADLAAKLAARDAVQARREMEEVRDAAREALAQIRQAVTGMHQPVLAAELALARRTLAAADVAFTVDAAALPLPAPIDATAAMILREAVTNVVRHASATRCAVTIVRGKDGVVRLTVEDDGQGSGVVREGTGLAGMRARAAALGGVLSIEPAAATGGTRLTVRFPPIEHAGEAAQ